LFLKFHSFNIIWRKIGSYIVVLFWYILSMWCCKCRSITIVKRQWKQLDTNEDHIIYILQPFQCCQHQIWGKLNPLHVLGLQWIHNSYFTSSIPPWPNLTYSSDLGNSSSLLCFCCSNICKGTLCKLYPLLLNGSAFSYMQNYSPSDEIAAHYGTRQKVARTSCVSC
jgi:hypothetical protein